ncbi:MAG: acetoacetate decarboxylase family protein [Anaerolineae bacterium]
MNILERILYTVPGGMFREFTRVMTYFTSRNLDLYARLLPAPFSVPKLPRIVVIMIDYYSAVWLGSHRYQEWAAMIRASWRGCEGYYVLTLPVTARFALIGGKYLGYPKYLADEITLSDNAGNRTVVAQHHGIEQLRLDYRPGLDRALLPWEQELVDNEDFFKGDPAFVLVPAGVGPRAQQVVVDQVVTPTWTSESGMVRIKVHPSETWAGLVPETGEFPGKFDRFSGGGNLRAVRD